MRRLKASAVYWLSPSECKTTPRAARTCRAMPSTERTKAAVCRAPMVQPTTLRLHTSITVARHRKPSYVGTYVMFATHWPCGPG